MLGFDGALGFAVFAYVLFLVVSTAVAVRLHGGLAARDRLSAVVVTSACGLLFLPLLLVIGYTVSRGLATLRPRFFTETQATVGPLSPATQGGALHAIVGTLEQVAIASILSVPLGIATAVFLSEVGGRRARPVRLVVDTMTAVPSVLCGLFVYAVVIVGFGANYNGFAAGLALAVLMLPTVTRASEVILRLVPGGLREASLALGASQWRTVWNVVLPTARAGLGTAVILGVARAVGETAPVLLTAGGAFELNANAFAGPQESMPQFIYRLSRFPQEAQQQRAWTGALVLVALVLVLFVIARLVAGRGPSPRFGRRTRSRRP